ncbi:MAG: hypothetical protein J6386_18220 [Candidatus Synoicihabitans palmerolidicus]|nr:hypothetical protein [Candidatus Synoicihabitans palmerolidicus]
MQSHELLKELLKKTSAKQVCSDMGLSLSLIYKWAEPLNENAGSGAVNSLDRVEQVMKTTADKRIAPSVAARAGGFFIHNPAAKRSSDELIPSTNQIVQQFADMLGIIATAAADQDIMTKEAARIRAQWEALKRVTEGFVQAAEAGNFSMIRDELKPEDHQTSSSAV